MIRSNKLAMGSRPVGTMLTLAFQHTYRSNGGRGCRRCKNGWYCREGETIEN